MISRVCALCYRLQEDSSEYETDSDEEQTFGGRRLLKPVFVPKQAREVSWCCAGPADCTLHAAAVEEEPGA